MLSHVAVRRAQHRKCAHVEEKVEIIERPHKINECGNSNFNNMIVLIFAAN